MMVIMLRIYFMGLYFACAVTGDMDEQIQLMKDFLKSSDFADGTTYTYIFIPLKNLIISSACFEQ